MQQQKWHRRLASTLALREGEAKLWNSVLYGLNIGVPVLAALALGSVREGVAGAIAGMLFSLADSASHLRDRLLLLARGSGMMLAFGLLGHFLGGYNAEFWAAFLALAFGTAWLSRKGHSGASALRYGALALVAMAGTPSGATTLLVLGVAIVTAALTRTVGSVAFPTAPFISAAPQRDGDEPEPGLRFCLLYAGMAAAGLVLGQIGGLERPTWVATTVLLVMQPYARASYERIVQRVFGTLVGVAAAAIIISLFHSLQVLVGCVLIVALLIPHGAPRNYWLHSALTALLILVLYDLAAAGHPFNPHLFSERVSDVLMGCALAFLGTVLTFVPIRFTHTEPDA